MDIKKLLGFMVDKGASDAFISVGVAPSLKINGTVMPVSDVALSAEAASEVVLGVMNEEQRQEFQQHHEANFALTVEGLGRFRASAFYQRNQPGMVLRRIEAKIPTIQELRLPAVIEDLAMTRRGLVIFVGATGTGKSTSLAAMIGYRNRNSTGHIICIEDPIEFLHEPAGCIVTQREVGIDTESFDVALKNTLRQAPDVIMIGEVRTRETMEQAVTFAETGHLCLCTMHANNANQALERISHFFPADRQQQLWMDLSLNLRGMVAQQLIASKDGKSRQAVVEVLLNTPLVGDMIRKGEVHALKGLMARSNELGMQTFDQSLFKAYKAGEVSEENALSHADSRNDLRLMIKLNSDGSDARDGASDLTFDQTGLVDRGRLRD